MTADSELRMKVANLETQVIAAKIREELLLTALHRLAGTRARNGCTHIEMQAWENLINDISKIDGRRRA